MAKKEDGILRVVKGNTMVRVNEAQLVEYLNQGWNQVDFKGKVIKKATGGVEVNIKQLHAAEAKIAELEAKIKAKETKK